MYFTIGPVTERPLTNPPALNPPGRQGAAGRNSIPEGLFTVNLRDDQKVPFSVSFRSRGGNVLDVAEVGTLTATSSDESIITVTDLGNGSYEAVTVGPLGSATVTVTNDHDDDGTPDFQGSIVFDVVPSDVFDIQINTGEPVSRFE